MSSYKPALPFLVPVHLLIPTYETIKGSPVKKYPKPERGNIIYCSFKTFGGTDVVKNDIYCVEDTASIETWYRPDVKSDCVLQLTNGSQYEILGEPENIEMHNQFLKFKVRRLKGGV